MPFIFLIIFKNERKLLIKINIFIALIHFELIEIDKTNYIKKTKFC